MMSARFSKLSLSRLETCDIRLQDIMHEVIKTRDIIILCGRRGQKEQDAAYYAGNSRLMFPHSKHNCYPSLAIDIALYPLDWKDIDGFVSLSKSVLEVAKDMNIELTWGGEWKMRDYPHYEIKLDKCMD